MIKLTRPVKPEQLAENEKILTEKFMLDGTNVWRKPYIVNPLARMSHEKCCFCETKLGEQAKNLQVEHFHCKNLYPEEVVLWENLFPACSQCNSNKGTHDTCTDPIINPCVDNPKDYLYLNGYRIVSKDPNPTSKGRLTVSLIDLNNRKRLVNPRLEIAQGIYEKLESMHETALAIKTGVESRQIIKNRLINAIRDILLMAQPEAEYSAFMATLLLNGDDYKAICSIMKEIGYWSDELQKLHNSASEIKLDTTN